MTPLFDCFLKVASFACKCCKIIALPWNFQSQPWPLAWEKWASDFGARRLLVLSDRTLRHPWTTWGCTNRCHFSTRTGNRGEPSGPLSHMVESWFGWWRWRTNSWGWYSRCCGLKLDQKESERILYSQINHWFPPIISQHLSFRKLLWDHSENIDQSGFFQNPIREMREVTTPFCKMALLMLLFIRCTYNKKKLFIIL